MSDADLTNKEIVTRISELHEEIDDLKQELQNTTAELQKKIQKMEPVYIAFQLLKKAWGE